MDDITVEVVFALRDEQISKRLRLRAGATVGQAISASRLLETHPEINVEDTGAGVWGRRVALEQPLRDGDRVEIYRPLLADPKVSRRERARKGTRGKARRHD